MVNRRTFLGTLGAAVAAFPTGAVGKEPKPSAKARPVLRRDALEPLRAFIDAEVAAGSVPGAGVIAAQDGKTILEHYAGEYPASTGASLPFGEGVRRILFSFSKGVATSVILTACQEGKLSLDEPIHAYIPEFTGGGKDAILLRHCLTHAAGVPSVPLGPVGTEEGWREAVKTMCAAEVEWAPGSRSVYHGLTGHFIAAEAMRRVCGNQPWQDLCDDRLFRYLGGSLSYSTPEPSETVSLTPPVLAQLPGQPFAGHPAGGCFGTLRDVMRILHLHLQHGVWEGHTVLEPNVLEEMHRIQFPESAQPGSAYQSWGVGWLLRGHGPADGVHAWFGFRDQERPHVFGHAGVDSIMGVADPDTGVALAFATTASPKNEEETVRLRNEVTNRVFATLTAEPEHKPDAFD